MNTNTGDGWTCPNCGMYVFWHTSHVCAPRPLVSNPQPTITFTMNDTNILQRIEQKLDQLIEMHRDD